MLAEFSKGDLVWFDPGIGYVLPGEVVEFHSEAQVRHGHNTHLMLGPALHKTGNWKPACPCKI